MRPRDVLFEVSPRTLAAPASVSGATQTVASDAGLWKATYSNLIIRERNHVLAFRAIANLLEGRLGSIVIPLCRAYQPLPDGFTSTETAALLDGVPHWDDAPFGDDSEYEGGTMSVELSSGISARAVSANIVVNYGGTIEPGQHFSIGERLYRVRTITYTTPTTAAITFRPPLREAAAAGAILDFDDPVVRVRLASDDAMDLDLSGRRFANPSVSFIEDV
nr:hypothetical protein [Mesorhizobium sp. IRAMC:0171]